MVEKFKKVVMAKKSEKIVFGVFVSLALMLFALPAYAAGEPTLITNAKKLADSALTWILILVIPAAGLMVGWHAIKKMMADGDPGSVAAANKSMKNTLMAAAIALSASGLVKVVLGFF